MPLQPASLSYVAAFLPVHDSFDKLSSCLLYTSYDGEQAILKHKPQLIFLDIELPSSNGLEFLAALHSKIDWEMNIIFYTSYEKYMLQALRMQAFDFLLKPVNQDDLLLAMNRYYLHRKNTQPSPIPSIHYPTDKPLLITTDVYKRQRLHY